MAGTSSGVKKSWAKRRRAAIAGAQSRVAAAAKKAKGSRVADERMRLEAIQKFHVPKRFQRLTTRKG